MKKQLLTLGLLGTVMSFGQLKAQAESSDTVKLSELEIVSSRYDKKTPFTATTLTGKQISERLGSRDIPNVLNTSPSVYSTNQGGGAGDSRINVRGFTQRNTAIMINGVPVNDMENGWVYWSNWDGLGDAASSIQVQRGLSAVNLAVPSIGGTVNVITSPADRKAGSYVRQEMGSWNFQKTTVGFNTGLINDKFAMNGTIVKKTGDGFYRGTWTDAWAYYFGASYKISNADKLEFYAIGAPQRHGQNLYRQNVGRYDRNFALGLEGYDPAALDKYPTKGRDFSQNVNSVDPRYTGQQYFTMYNSYNQSRFNPNFMNERENYFHKPQVNLNWYHDFNDKMRLSSIAYWSGGQGGGTGTYGSVKTSYGAVGAGLNQWDTEIAENSNNIDSNYSTSLNRSTGILRNSINQQYTWGAISKLEYDINPNLNILVGLDWRTAEIKHWREVRDLLGGDYYVFGGNDFATSDMKTLGDQVAYSNTNTVDWLGGYLQAKYTTRKLRAEVMAAYTNVSYTYTNNFRKDAATGNAVFSENTGLGGYQLKGGASYDWTSKLQSFANFGLVSRNPTFDGAIRDSDGFVYADPQNETFNSIDAGIKWSGLNNKLAIAASGYYTQWLNRTRTFNYTEQNGTEGVVYLTGMNAVHSGLELEVAYKPTDRLRIDIGASAGNWYLTDDISGNYTTYKGDTPIINDYNYYVKGLKVGDAPQQQLSAVINYKFSDNFNAQLVIRHYDNFYSDWDVFSRTNEELDVDGNRVQAWKTPAYTVMDLHANYTVPVDMGNARLSVFAHVFNLADAVYIQDATDNSRYNAFDKDHDADDAEVFLGLPRNFNAGFRVSF